MLFTCIRKVYIKWFAKFTSSNCILKVDGEGVFKVRFQFLHLYVFYCQWPSNSGRIRVVPQLTLRFM